MKPCACDEKWNLPMEMCEEEQLWHWIECDFCGNKTLPKDTPQVALFKWNEFQAAKGVKKKLKGKEN